MTQEEIIAGYLRGEVSKSKGEDRAKFDRAESELEAFIKSNGDEGKTWIVIRAMELVGEK